MSGIKSPNEYRMEEEKTEKNGGLGGRGEGLGVGGGRKGGGGKDDNV